MYICVSELIAVTERGALWIDEFNAHATAYSAHI